MKTERSHLSRLPSHRLRAMWALAALMGACSAGGAEGEGEAASASVETSGTSGSGEGASTGAEVASLDSAAEVRSEDVRLAQRVHVALARAPEVDASAFLVRAAAGVVTLHARGETEGEPVEALRVARAVGGVGDVRWEPAPVEAAPLRLPGVSTSGGSDRLSLYRSVGTRRAEEPEFVPPAAGAASHRAASGDRPRTYRVRAGDSLSAIASRTLRDGNQWRRIYELNRSVIGPDPARLVEGMELRIPQD